MLSGGRAGIKKSRKDDAEKPFWISYADLMTALMVLFLVVMSVSLLAVTRKVSQVDQLKKEREEDIQKLLDKVEKASPGLSVDRKNYRINFGDKAHFEIGQWVIDADSADFLRAYVPKILAIPSDPLGKKWLKRFVVEGYTDATGDYLLNLDLSLKRSESVICALFTKDANGEYALSQNDLQQIRDLFMVGGFAFNNAKKTEKESRRIELRIEFWGLDEVRDTHQHGDMMSFGDCKLK